MEIECVPEKAEIDDDLIEVFKHVLVKFTGHDASVGVEDDAKNDETAVNTGVKKKNDSDSDGEEEKVILADMELEYFENFWFKCPWDEDLKYPRVVCDQLSVFTSIHLLCTHFSLMRAKCFGDPAELHLDPEMQKEIDTLASAGRASLSVLLLVSHVQHSVKFINSILYACT
ncbi:hypothetical protein J5N97_002291 [Dioscorea zingiberensis]|uniref:Uncharacterized protein n=1 Tax=Dioscorea zingiberensis TaxID=325984 RepID=A0A9D5D4I2_9LILI|nr:hypothetical protein J5N97_002291 [Dioscorea zingiberensis]